jgi:hypothetical protein
MLTSTEHKQSFLSVMEIFLQLSAQKFLALLLQESTEPLVSLKLVPHTMVGVLQFFNKTGKV